MTARREGAFTANLSWLELEQRVQAGAVAVLPVGAACKQHGPHLPMNTDYLQAEWLAAALIRRAEVLVWPCVSYGYYPAFTDYPGSISLTVDTFQVMVREILSDIRRAGVRGVLILNTGISTIEPLDVVVHTVRSEIHVRLVNVYEGPRYRRLVEDIEEQPCGGHADELETSLMLIIAPKCVARQKEESWTPPSMPDRGRFSRRDPEHPRFSPGGVWGDPTLANERKGRRLLAAMVEDLLAAPLKSFEFLTQHTSFACLACIAEPRSFRTAFRRYFAGSNKGRDRHLLQ